MFTVLEVYNNIPYDPDIKADFGYSCFIKEPGVLFDSGAHGDILLYNLNRLGISVDQINYFVLSHDHWDHNGGIGALLDENPNIISYCPPDTSEETRMILSRGAGCFSTHGWLELSPGVFLTGPVEGSYAEKKITEQSIVLENEKGLFLITGCSHPHISKILGYVKNKGDVFGVVGGFHDVNEEDVRSLEGLEYLSPSHCTTAIEAIAEEFGENFVRSGAGFIHRI